MFSAFSRLRNLSILISYLLAFGFFLAPLSEEVFAETGSVSAVGTGRDTADAISNLLRNTVGRYFQQEPVPLTRAILQSEILPNASSFVQSYKIIDGGRSGSVTLSASVDIGVIQGLLNLTPKNVGDQEGARYLVLVRGAKLPDSVLSGMKAGSARLDPFLSLTEGARERFSRREFTEVKLSAEDLQSIGTGEDVSGPELLRGLGAKAGARLALGISGHFETYDNENSHNKEERLVISATMIDVKAGSVIARSSVHVLSPKTRRDQYLADLQRGISEESKDLFQEVFVAAGRRLGKSEQQSEFSIVRVLFPSNVGLLMRFKSLLEAVPGVRSVIDFSVRRGSYDFAIRPAMSEAALSKALGGVQSSEILITPAKALTTVSDAHPPAITVKLAPREAAASGSEEGTSNARK